MAAQKSSAVPIVQGKPTQQDVASTMDHIIPTIITLALIHHCLRSASGTRVLQMLGTRTQSIIRSNQCAQQKQVTNHTPSVCLITLQCGQ